MPLARRGPSDEDGPLQVSRSCGLAGPVGSIHAFPGMSGNSNRPRPRRARPSARARAANDFSRMLLKQMWQRPQLSFYLHINAVGKLGEPIPIQISMFDSELTQPDVLVYAWTEANHIRVCS